jgi:hypothetical protein
MLTQRDLIVPTLGSRNFESPLEAKGRMFADESVRVRVKEHSRNKRPLEFRPPRDITSGTAQFGASRHPDGLRG